MINVKMVTKARGFLSYLISYPFKNMKFINFEDKVYEIPTKGKIKLSKFVGLRIFDFIGLFLRINNKSSEGDVNFSYNRFLKTDKPYVILLENPLALVHYSVTRPFTLASKFRLKKCFNDKNLKAIICLSKSCYQGMHYYYNFSRNELIHQLYPMVMECPYVNQTLIMNKSRRKTLKCLYVSSDFQLKGGDDILEAFNKLESQGYDAVNLLIITKIGTLTKEQKQTINDNKLIEVCEFNLDKEKLYEYYAQSNILLHPTRKDSSPLVVLEAIKFGCVFIGTNLYAISEMVQDGYNGFLTEPKYKYWNDDNTLNVYVQKHQSTTINMSYVDQNIVDLIFQKVIYLQNNRNILEQMSLNSYAKATTGEFSNQYIADNLENIIKEAVQK